MAQFGLIKSFNIDHGELDGLRAQDCFVLGYELADIDWQLKSGEAVRRPVHCENRERIESACRDAKRAFSISWMPGDASESWLLLEVESE